ncbi:Flp pilus assembly protein CpaB [Siccirubricoccus deserti]
MPAGTLLKDEDFATREMPPQEIPDGAIIAGEEGRMELRGALLRRYLDAGAIPQREDMLRPRDRGFLAAVLRPGTRAIAVGVDVVTGAAGLIWPGDQVDLILTQELGVADAPWPAG